jgi:hypothetical protein
MWGSAIMEWLLLAKVGCGTAGEEPRIDGQGGRRALATYAAVWSSPTVGAVRAFSFGYGVVRVGEAAEPGYDQAWEEMMLTPDEQLALDILDALDLRIGPKTHPVLNEVGRDERWRLEQQCQMADALVNWLERWMVSPQQEDLQSEAASLWQTVTALHDHLVVSRGQLRLRVEEMDEATEGVWLALSEARGGKPIPPHGIGQRGS